jgi:Family of unknown function (DUF6088)
LQSIHNQIYNKIIKNKRGKLFFPSEFTGLGSVHAVNMAFSRLEKDHVLERLAQGVYLYPKKDPQFGILYPSTEEIALEIARRDHAKIIPTGATALHRLGLSTQVPMNVIYLTDGAPRKIKIGKQKITFKPTTAKKLATKGAISSLVIQALRELKKQNTDQHIIDQVLSALKKEELKNLKNDVKLAPAWIAGILKQAIENNTDDRMA